MVYMFLLLVISIGSTTSAVAKLSKTTPGSSLSKQQGEKKETPQERLKRIMSKQLNKQSIIILMFILGEALHLLNSNICCHLQSDLQD